MAKSAQNKWLIVSLLINLILICSICAIKRVKIQSMANVAVAKIFPKHNSDRLLSQMNKERLNYLDAVYGAENIDSVRILVLGNSIALHPVLPAVNWEHISGMAASAIDSDYVHILMRKISAEKKQKVVLQVINIADFEREYSVWDFSELKQAIHFTPDVVIFQLGENVQFKKMGDSSLFISKYVGLVNEFNSSERIITTQFLPSREKNEVISTVALQTSSTLVDLSHLPLLDDRNYARSERPFLNEGVGIHPGNFGMKNIANAIFLGMSNCIGRK